MKRSKKKKKRKRKDLLGHQTCFEYRCGLASFPQLQHEAANTL